MEIASFFVGRNIKRNDYKTLESVRTMSERRKQNDSF
jgi:hypothetical protein